MSSFPTHTNADWQWYDLLTQSFAININSLPLFYQPVVHLIDFFKNNNRLAMIMEANVGRGKLLVCTLNLGDANERSITQQQMLKSLIAYMQSRKFNPQALLTPDQLNNVFENRN
jgi:hypothetical protein